MTTEELIRFIDGPLAALLAKDGVTYGRFIEMIRDEFPEITIRYAHLYPRLFNLVAVPCEADGEPVLSWDIDAVAKEYISKVGPAHMEKVRTQLQAMKERKCSKSS